MLWLLSTHRWYFFTQQLPHKTNTEIQCKSARNLWISVKIRWAKAANKRVFYSLVAGGSGSCTECGSLGVGPIFPWRTFSSDLSPVFQLLFSLAKTPHPPTICILYPACEVFLSCRNLPRKATWKGGHRTGEIIKMTSLEDRGQQPESGEAAPCECCKGMESDPREA